MTLQTSDGTLLPKTYPELYKQYGPFVHNFLKQRNKIERNQEDLEQYIWLKIVDAQLLQRFWDNAQRQMPKVLTALEACMLLGVSWNQWVAAMHTAHRGVQKYNAKGKKAGRKKGLRWMPTPINLLEFEAQGVLGYTSKKALFDFDDIIHLSYYAERDKKGVIRKAFRKMGRDVDANGKVIAETRPEGFAKLPEVKVTKSQFKHYLQMAIGNHFANFCRTAERRHKERPVTPPPHQEDAPSWESTLEDTISAGSDSMVALTDVKQLLSNTIYECLDGNSCRPVSEVETEVFRMIEDGASLMQALGKAGVSAKARSAILDTIRPLAMELA